MRALRLTAHKNGVVAHEHKGGDRITMGYSITDQEQWRVSCNTDIPMTLPPPIFGLKSMLDSLLAHL